MEGCLPTPTTGERENVMRYVCAHAKQCALYRHMPRGMRQADTQAPSICQDPAASQRCRRARYLEVYGDDAPLCMPALTGRPAGRVWLRT